MNDLTIQDKLDSATGRRRAFGSTVKSSREIEDILAEAKEKDIELNTQFLGI